jgi:hypothetical protein
VGEIEREREGERERYFFSSFVAIPRCVLYIVKGRVLGAEISRFIVQVSFYTLQHNEYAVIYVINIIYH